MSFLIYMLLNIIYSYIQYETFNLLTRQQPSAYLIVLILVIGQQMN